MTIDLSESEMCCNPYCGYKGIKRDGVSLSYIVNMGAIGEQFVHPWFCSFECAEWWLNSLKSIPLWQGLVKSKQPQMDTMQSRPTLLDILRRRDYDTKT